MHGKSNSHRSKMKMALAAAALGAGLAAQADATTVGINFRYYYYGTEDSTIDTSTSDIIDGVPAGDWNNMAGIDELASSPLSFTGQTLTSPGASGVTLDYSAVNAWQSMYPPFPAQTDPIFPYIGYLDDTGAGYSVTIHGLSSILASGESYRIRALQGSDNATGFQPVKVYAGTDTTGTLLATISNSTTGSGGSLYGDTDESIWLTTDTITLVGLPRSGTLRSTLAGLVIDSGVPVTGTVVWDGDVNSTWDVATTSNWILQSDSSDATYLAGEDVIFNDAATTDGTITLSGVIAPASLTFDNSSKTYTLTGSGISGATGLTKTGTGTVTLLNANTFAGPIAVTAGTLAIGDGTTGNVSGSGDITVASAATLSLNLPSGANFPHSISDPNPLTVGGTGGLTLGGAITGGSTLTLSRNGTVTMPGSGLDTAITVQSGCNLAVTGGGWTTSFFSSASSRAIHLQSGAALTTNTHSLGGLGGALYQPVITIDAGSTWVLNAEQYMDPGNIVLNGGHIYVSTNDLRLIDGGTLVVGASTAGAVIDGSSATLHSDVNFNVADGAATNDLRVNLTGGMGESDGSHGITKSGAGQMLIESPATYTGMTTVSEGTLIVNCLSGSGTGTGAVSVSAGAVLGGFGVLSGPVSVSGSISPGPSTATLTTGALSLGGSYACDIDGMGADKLAVNGDLDLTGAALSITVGGGGATQSTYVIATYTGTLTGTFSSVSGIPSGYSLNYNTGAKQIEIALPTGYTTWLAGYPGLSDTSASADPDHDGLSNGVEFVLGGNPTTSSSDIAPTSAYDGSGNLIFTFRRTSASSYLNPTVEYSPGLDVWTTAADGTDGISITTTANFYGSGIDKVVATLPSTLAPDGKLFARLKVTVP